MKRFSQLRYLVLFAITVSGTAGAETFSQKTFFSPRAVGVNRAMEYTTWHELEFGHTAAPSKSKIHSHIALTPFYQESQKATEIGKYFGIGNGKNSFRVDRYTPLAGQPAPEVINSYLIHDSTAHNASPLSDTVSFNPKQEIYGFRLDYFQDVDHPFKKFFFKASLPVVHVQNDMGLKTPNNSKVVTATSINGKYTLKDFFAGRIDEHPAAGHVDTQHALTKAKIDGRRSCNGLADLNLALGYKLHTSPKNHLFFNAGILIPTGSKKRGDYLFEPRCGNGGHTGFTAGIDGGVTLWTSSAKEASVRLLGSLDYTYLFEATEYRTLALKPSFFAATDRAGGGKFNFYYLGKEINKDYGYPAANIFTRGLTVKPGSQAEGTIDLSFKCSGFVVDLGYNTFYKEKESVWLKNWNAQNFIIVDRDNQMNAHNRSAHSAAPAANAVSSDITAADFDMESVTNPSQFTHKVFGGIGYTFPLVQKYLATLGMGASYEFATDNAAMEAMALWAKMGISF